MIECDETGSLTLHMGPVDSLCDCKGWYQGGHGTSSSQSRAMTQELPGLGCTSPHVHAGDKPPRAAMPVSWCMRFVLGLVTAGEAEQSAVDALQRRQTALHAAADQGR